jgi:tetratricopeptide (TPR) repeat protein
MLLSLATGSAFHPHEGRIYSETMLPRIHFGWSELRSLIDARHHFIQAPRSELYDVATDPAERTNIAESERRTFAEMRNELAPRGAFTEPSSVDPEEARKLAALGYVGEVRSTGDLTDPKDRIQDLEDLKAGRVEELVKRNPTFTDAWLRLAAKQERAGKLEEAVQSYRSAIEAAPVLAPNAALSLGALLLRLGRLDEAAQHAELALATQPAAAHHLLGRIALARRDSLTAAREARLAMSDALYRNAATVLLARAVGGTEGLSLLDGIGRQVRDLELTRAEILAGMDRGEEAEAAFRREIAAYPNNTDAYTHLAILHFAMGRDPEPDLRAMQEAVPGTEKLAQQVRSMLK